MKRIKFLGRPKTVYTNPCKFGTPLTDDLSGSPIACDLRSDDTNICPKSYNCTAVAGSTQAVCCPSETLSMFFFKCIRHVMHNLVRFQVITPTPTKKYFLRTRTHKQVTQFRICSLIINIIEF